MQDKIQHQELLKPMDLSDPVQKNAFDEAVKKMTPEVQAYLNSLSIKAWR